MSRHNRIFIIGHSGAGKAVLAQALAKKLGWQFIDADFSMTAAIGRSLSEILGRQGEENFRHCLSDILANQIKKENIVVTTDDSLIVDEKCRNILAAEFSVHLTVSPSVQLERLSQHRPLLPVTDYKAFLQKLRQERDSLYEQAASYSLSSDSGDVEEHTANVIKAFGK